MDREQLFERYSTQIHEDLWKYTLARVRDKDIADEIHQEVLIKLWRKADQLRDENSFWKWAAKISRNTVKRTMKTRAKHNQRNQSIYDNSEIDYMGFDKRAESAEEAALTRMDVQDAQTYIDSLPPLTKQIVVLHANDELTFDEIGKLLGMPSATVKSKYFRAKHKFEELSRR